ncbi:phosphatidylserine decarboxylase [Arcobacter sp. FWKO B]|uniref:phosphatidylserine decarboxylase n=1 Tax=Arcobacter sp. FWKO B TaxID=2593672 RepID=UPI0018A4373C|nr:phosphatidylserine decarboxylase [Arcobacter sp. FWKO B]QOG12550.1 phosphatidylserine decarboxylase [Arcobacter sp. FWKO B]
MHSTNKISRMFGKFASYNFPRPIQNLINYSYVKLLGLDMQEFYPPSYYKSLNELFTRELKVPRVIDVSLDNFISPSDSFITSCGRLEKDSLLQIKGMSYSVSELLTNHISQENLLKVSDGEYMNFYLSPKDYHRYHSPYYAKVTKLIHIPAKLYPVNVPYLKKEQDLFIKNERVVLECFDENGRVFYMVFVGALNVGDMVFSFDNRVETNKDNKNIQVYEYENLHISKGDCLGYFKMGSTVVMIWEKDFVKLNNLENTKVSFGTIVADIENPK